MRMISRREALKIIADHGWKSGTCTNGNHGHSIGRISPDNKCGTFNGALGIHDQYAVIDVKNWLGY